jgi:hypothetical protein
MKRISPISYENGFEDGYEKREREFGETVKTKSKVVLRTLKDETKGYVITACFVPREWAGKTVDVCMSLGESNERIN